MQRGVVRWFLALHSPDFNIIISPDKLPRDPEAEDSSSQTSTQSQENMASQSADPESLPSLGGYTDLSVPSAAIPSDEDIAAAADTEIDGLPVPFTPSINKTLNMKVTKSGQPVLPLMPLPVGMTIPMLRGRLDPKKKIK